MKAEKVLKEIAKKNGVTVKEVRAEMQKAINEAWGKARIGSLTQINQREVPHKGAVPTPEELVRYLAEKTGQGENGR